MRPSSFPIRPSTSKRRSTAFTLRRLPAERSASASCVMRSESTWPRASCTPKPRAASISDEATRLLPRLVDELAPAILAHLQAPLERLALLGLESLERGEAAQRAIAGERRGYPSPGGERLVLRLSGVVGHRAADSTPGTAGCRRFGPRDG